MKTPFLLLTEFLLLGCNLYGFNSPGVPIAKPDPVAAGIRNNIPTSSTTKTPSPKALIATNGSISFIINVHDWVHVQESADTLIHLIDIFDRYRVKGDFYFTAPVVENLVQQRPDVITRLIESDMTISYHVRPPHPLYNEFDARLQRLNDRDLFSTLMEYETYALDMATGELDKSRAGGYSYVAKIFGAKPVVVGAPNNDPRIKETAKKVYASLGAKMVVLYHEEGTKIDRPFEYTNGLLIRPSDFSITRVNTENGENFWWNMLKSPESVKFDPTKLLQTTLGDWNASRPPFITSLIHENNFYRSGPEAWTGYYFDYADKNKPLQPPYNLTTSDPSKVRTAVEQQTIWNAYERLVAYSVTHLQVVTSEYLVSQAFHSKE